MCAIMRKEVSHDEKEKSTTQSRVQTLGVETSERRWDDGQGGVCEDLLDDRRLLHARDYFHRVTAALAGLDVDLGSSTIADSIDLFVHTLT